MQQINSNLARTLVVVSLIVIGGCVQSQAVPCGDTLCPAGSVCTVTGRCQFQQDIDACQGKPEKADCIGRSGDGVCLYGACGVGQCGDGISDAGEDCDDGNANDADSCTSKCQLNRWSASLIAGGPVAALDIEISLPRGVATDVDGNIFLVDGDRVRRIDVRSGAITTVAGTGVNGYSGDDGQATGAQLNQPSGVAVDGRGYLYIADSRNQRIRQVDGNGVITTIAGTGVAGFYGDGVKASNAQMYNPAGVAVDGRGNVFFADQYNDRVRRIDAQGIITTFAGTGVGGYSQEGIATEQTLNFPTGIAVDQDGNVLIADKYNYRIRKVDTSGVISTIAGNGTLGDGGDGLLAVNARLNAPSGIAIDNIGNLYIVGNDQNQIRIEMARSIQW
jgi:cysteine-rich repeat protein